MIKIRIIGLIVVSFGLSFSLTKNSEHTIATFSCANIEAAESTCSSNFGLFRRFWDFGWVRAEENLSDRSDQSVAYSYAPDGQFVPYYNNEQLDITIPFGDFNAKFSGVNYNQLANGTFHSDTKGQFSNTSLFYLVSKNSLGLQNANRVNLEIIEHTDAYGAYLLSYYIDPVTNEELAFFHIEDGIPGVSHGVEQDFTTTWSDIRTQYSIGLMYRENNHSNWNWLGNIVSKADGSKDLGPDSNIGGLGYVIEDGKFILYFTESGWIENDETPLKYGFSSTAIAGTPYCIDIPNMIRPRPLRADYEYYARPPESRSIRPRTLDWEIYKKGDAEYPYSRKMLTDATDVCSSVSGTWKKSVLYPSAASASVDQVMAFARNGQLFPWKKFNGSVFNVDPIHGQGSPITFPTNDGSNAILDGAWVVPHGSAAYISESDEFVITYAHGPLFDSQGVKITNAKLYVCTSPDPLEYKDSDCIVRDYAEKWDAYYPSIIANPQFSSPDFRQNIPKNFQIILPISLYPENLFNGKVQYLDLTN